MNTCTCLALRVSTSVNFMPWVPFCFTLVLPSLEGNKYQNKNKIPHSPISQTASNLGFNHWIHLSGPKRREWTEAPFLCCSCQQVTSWTSENQDAVETARLGIPVPRPLLRRYQETFVTKTVAFWSLDCSSCDVLLSTTISTLDSILLQFQLFWST